VLNTAFEAKNAGSQLPAGKLAGLPPVSIKAYEKALFPFPENSAFFRLCHRRQLLSRISRGSY